MQNPANKDSARYNRRTFLKSSTVAVAGLTVADYGFAAAKTETLAMSGGEKTVSFPKDQFAALTKWPRYGDAEKQALCDLLDNNKFYDELPAFEKEWKDYTKSPFVKNHINGTSALTSMYFALDLPPGSEIMVPSYTFFATCLAMRFFGCVPIFIDIDPKTATLGPGGRQAQADAPHHGGGADALVGAALPDGRASATGPRRRASSSWKTPPTRTARRCRARRWAPGA